MHHRRSAGQLCHHPHDVPWRYAEQHGNDYNDYKYHNKIIGMSGLRLQLRRQGVQRHRVLLWSGWILAVVGFTGNMEVITPAVRYGIYTFSLYIPLAMFVGLFILISKFDLEAKYGDMMKAIAERNEKEKTAQ